LKRGGKRLRPSLTLLAAGAGEIDDDLAGAAAIVEFVHLASLYHDDVIDRSARRRGGETANARWGATVAALVGSHLFACAGRAAAALGDVAVREMGRAADDLQTGQARETEHLYDTNLEVDEHLRILGLKTTSLFRLAVLLGVAGHEDAAARRPALEAYAGHLGLAFQLADDVLDLVGDPAAMGKDPGDDIAAGAYSLPLLLTLARRDATSGALRTILARDSLTADELAEIRTLIANAGTLAEVRERAREEARRAEQTLSTLPDDLATRALQQIATFAVDRVA
jgi:geranylgeranyl pyrophosphate synthase